jgi:23S rRNA (cytidine1920-2'-O)/16S rRNA (cytidine1409-2'-O)-methyltransferase
MRADLLLVERGLAPSRTAAQRLIAGGHVYASAGALRVALAKASTDLAADASVEIENNPLERYVSRGGLKLEGALDRAGLNVSGMRCLDVGQSTGGFTDCLLQRGATQVTGVDVGHDQLHAKIRSDSRVTCIERVNARQLSATTSGAACHAFDLIVADVSFISVTKVLPQWPALLSERGRVLSLVKPQFEVGAGNLARGGIVRDESLFAVVEATIRAACKECRLQVMDYFESPITGSDGNREFFVYAVKS